MHKPEMLGEFFLIKFRPNKVDEVAICWLVPGTAIKIPMYQICAVGDHHLNVKTVLARSDL